ncbi:hypothetical protein NC651_005549 [Populus alba x Populus x berolinensis]|nr:hypothetical protein NC651_005549 [Populus alba x Populus x berolinensis]
MKLESHVAGVFGPDLRMTELRKENAPNPKDILVKETPPEVPHERIVNFLVKKALKKLLTPRKIFLPSETEADQ